MKCSIPEISWHNREPVLSADFQPLNATNNDFYRLATGGSDNLVLIWKLKAMPDGQVDVTVLSELTRHQRSVNCVKWSPNGELLASADDDANIIIWQLKTDNIPSFDEREDEFEERWNALKVLRGHKEDVYDLCWSPKSDKLLSGSVDNTAILWDVLKGKNEHIIKDHKGFIQGVAWDPKSDFLATLCSDRICRVFDRNGRRVRARIGRGRLPVDESNEFYEKEVKYFHDDTFKTYFRRLNFTPDGSLLLVPSGAVETEEKKNALFGTFAFTLDALNDPVCVLPSGTQCSIAVRCCPILFELRDKGPKPVINLPYRMIIAVATDSDVILYDTQQMAPCVHLQNIHYTRLTDLTWSADGLLLAAASTDGFITLVTFEDGELGTLYLKEESDVEDSVLNISGCEALPQDETEINAQVKVAEEIEHPKEKSKKPSFLEQWTKQANKRKNDEVCGEVKDSKKVKNYSTDSDDTKIKEGNVEIEQEKSEVAVIETKTQDIQGEVKKKRITPILICKETKKKSLSPPKLSPQVPIKAMSKIEESAEVKAKRRIQPIKIGETAKLCEKMPALEKVAEKPMEVDQNMIKVDKDENKVDISSKSEGVTQKPVETLKPDVLKMPTPLTPKNKLENVEKSKGTSNAKKTPGQTSQTTPQTEKSTSEKTSSSKKLQSNTLFKYLKPIGKTPTESATPKNEDLVKSDFKPQKLFGKEPAESIPQNGKSTVKVKVAKLFKPSAEAKAVKVKAEPTVQLVSEDTTPDIPEDFVLKVDDDVITINDDTNEAVEKENETDKIDASTVEKKLLLDVPLKAEAKRRIPLITLSSPKNKKKPITAD